MRSFVSTLVVALCTVLSSCSKDSSSGPSSGGAPPPPVPVASCAVPPGGAPADTSKPTTVVGDGTPASCTESALDAAVQAAGIVTFDCGAAPVTIKLTQQIQIKNNAGTDGLGDTVIDGGGLVTLDGGGQTRILYLNACQPPYNSSHCNTFPHPSLTVQNLTFANGQIADTTTGGGAIYVNGGALKVVSSSFFNNHCAVTNNEIHGGAIATYLQTTPVFIVGSTFGGGAGKGNSCSVGGALGSIGTSYTVINSVISGNSASGLGSGGGIDNDGDTYTLTLCGVTLTNNVAQTFGGGIFYVSNDGTGATVINNSLISGNSIPTKGQGGGLYLQGSQVAITGTTIANNSAAYAAGLNEYTNQGVGSLDMVNVTVANHPGTGLEIADDVGGTLARCTLAANVTGLSGGGKLSLADTILASNTTANCTESHAGSGGNLQFPEGGTACAAGIVFGDPQLGPLADNGGPVPAMTMLPGAGSQAIKAGTTCPAIDERGDPRPSTGCTSGACEVE
jgi:hypothetical protein